jgi:hypothetical protein
VVLVALPCCRSGGCGSTGNEHAPEPFSYRRDGGALQVTAADAVTALDPRTGLTWQRRASPSSMTAAQAQQWCAQAPTDGAPWRLPSRLELATVVDFNANSPAIDVATFPEAPLEIFWSASPVAGTPGAFWGVHLRYGESAVAVGDVLGRARCVRGERPSPRPLRVEPDAVVDDRTALRWRRRPDGAAADHAGAAATCAALGGGHRLPTVLELLSIVDAARREPAVDPDAFPGTPSLTFWTDTVFRGEPHRHWGVDFLDGQSVVARDADAFAVRCVTDAPVVP